MTGRPFGLGVCVLSLSLTLGTHARASSGDDELDAIDRSAMSAMADGAYAFCTNPQRPLGLAERRICPLAAEVEGCTALVAACDAALPTPAGTESYERFFAWVSPIATALLYALVLAIAVLIALPVLRALRGWRRGMRIATPGAAAPNRAVVDDDAEPPPPPADADSLFRLAEDERAAGRLDRALGLYLVASLAALDRRGALRLTKHSTNGEYVCALSEPALQGALREIVREVDAVEFGAEPASAERIRRVAARAEAIVRRTTLIASVIGALFLGGCTPPHAAGADPTGDELPRAVLDRNGFQVKNLDTSVATMPVHTGTGPAPVVIIDTERVNLEPDTRAHLVRWVESGGTLVLFGVPRDWPSEPSPEERHASANASSQRSAKNERELLVRGRVVETNEAAPSEDSLAVRGAHVARASGVSWKGSEPVAVFAGAEADAADPVAYAVRRDVGHGTVLEIANDDLLTNVGVLPRRNAAALVTLVRSIAAAGELRFARTEDGIPPPSNPFAALVTAGLAKGAWHALAASLILFLAFGTRRNAPRTPKPETRRAFTEHVEATASLYDRTNATSHAVAVYAQYVAAPPRAGGAPLRGIADDARVRENAQGLASPGRARPRKSASETTASGTPKPGTR